MTITVGQLFDVLDSTQLLSAADVSRIRKVVPDDSLATDAEKLTRELVRHGKLTNYQAAAVYQGKSRALFVGNYIILNRLGRGGTATVFKAKHREKAQIVALKILSKKASRTLDLLSRFKREMAATAALNHQNIVSAFDLGESSGGESFHFLVVEHVDGHDLEALVKQKGPLSVKNAVNYMTQAALGLAHAHQMGIVHRDIKPSNLMLDKSGVVKVLDLGLARLDDSLEMEGDGALEGLTQTGRIMGTVDYMSPEQALDTKKTDPRTDIYSLGCTLFFLLTGRTMFAGDTIMKKLLAHRQRQAPSLCQVRPEVPESVNAVFQQMVAKKREDRFQSMDEVVAALEGSLDADRGVEPVDFGTTDDVFDDVDDTLSDERDFTSFDFEDVKPAPLLAPPKTKTKPKISRRSRSVDWTKHSKTVALAAGAVFALMLLVAGGKWVASLFPEEQEQQVQPEVEHEAVLTLAPEMTVGPEGDFSTIAEALAFVVEHFQPGVTEWDRQTIRVNGGANYDERIVIDNSDGTFPKGVRVVSDGTRPAKLAPKELGPAVVLTGVADFTLQGFELAASLPDVGVDLKGAVSKIVLRDLRINGCSTAGVRIDGAAGQLGEVDLAGLIVTSDRPDAVGVVCTVVGDGQGTLNMSSCFFGGGMSAGVEVSSALKRLHVQGNVFHGPADGVRFANGAQACRSVLIANNSFHGTTHGLAFSAVPGDECGELAVTRNLFASPSAAEAVIKPAVTDDVVLALQKRFSRQWSWNWSTRTPTGGPSAGEIDIFGKDGRRGLELHFASTDAHSADYLRPLEATTEPLSAEAGLQPYIGARPPMPDAVQLSPTYQVRRLLSSAGIKHLAVSCAGELVLTADEQNAVRGWNVDTGQAVFECEPLEQPISNLAVAPDGASFVTGSMDGSLRLFNVRSREEVSRFEPLEHGVTAAAWSRDGRYVAIGDEQGGLSLRVVQSGDVAWQQQAHMGAVRHIVFSPTGHIVLTAGNDGQARLWNTLDATQLTGFAGHDGPVLSAAFAPNGNSVATGGADGTVRFWNVVNSAEQHVTRGHTGPIRSVVYAHSGELVISGGEDRTVRAWKAATGEGIRLFREHTAAVNGVAVASDGQTAISASGDRSLRVWDLGGLHTVSTASCNVPPALDFTNSVGMRFVRIPAGEFQMGSPESESERRPYEQLHSVRLTRPLYVGVYEVTQAEYERVMGENPSEHRATNDAEKQRPVENVSWTDAVEFCKRLSALPEERSARRVYRLPTEAEWEFACRGGATAVFGVGDALSSELANFDGSEPYGDARRRAGPGQTTPVGSYRPNLFGLFDMHGNVYEWCLDLYDEDFYEKSPTDDPQPPETELDVLRSNARVIRGGGWSSRGSYCRSAARRQERAESRFRHIGFRVVCVSAGGEGG